MNFSFKLIACCLGLWITLWKWGDDVADKLLKRSDDKIETKVTEIRREMLHYREERNMKISALDSEMKTELGALKVQMSENNRLLRELVRNSKKEYVFKQELEHRFNESI